MVTMLVEPVTRIDGKTDTTKRGSENKNCTEFFVKSTPLLLTSNAASPGVIPSGVTHRIKLDVAVDPGVIWSCPLTRDHLHSIEIPSSAWNPTPVIDTTVDPFTSPLDGVIDNNDKGMVYVNTSVRLLEHPGLPEDPSQISTRVASLAPLGGEVHSTSVLDSTDAVTCSVLPKTQDLSLPIANPEQLQH